MKLRIKLDGEKLYFDVSADCVLSELKSAVCDLIGSPSVDDIRLSLNGVDELTDTTCPIRRFGIVSGDLIHIIGDAATSSRRGVHHPVLGEKEAGKEKIGERSELSTASGSETTRNPTQAADASSRGVASTTSKQLDCIMVMEEGITDQLSEAYKMASSMADAIFAAVHVAGLETGLKEKLPESNETSRSSNKKPPVSLWRQAPGFYQTTYWHPLCPRLSCTVSGSLVAKHLMLGGAVNMDDAEAFQVSLNVTNYANQAHTASTEPQHFYKNISSLAKVVKQSIFNKLLDAMKTASGVANGISSLPMDVEVRLMMFLDFASLLRLSRTCLYLNECANDQRLWKFLCQRDMQGQTPDCVDSSFDWKKHYKQCLIDRRRALEWRERHPNMQFDPPWPGDIDYSPHGAFHETHPPQFPGMIGGYHDLHPAFPYMPGGLHPVQPNQRPHLPRARFDPYGPLPEQHIRPRRPGGGPSGPWDPSGFI